MAGAVARFGGMNTCMPHIALKVRRAPVRLASSVAAAAAEATSAAEATTSLADKVAHFQKQERYNSSAVQSRTIVQNAKLATLCTISNEASTKGFPFGASSACAVDVEGKLIVSLSSLSSHTRDLRADSRCSFHVQEAGFEGMADGRVCITGRLAEAVSADEAAACREVYMKAHPDHFWADFGDFAFFRLDEIVAVRLIAGFGRAASVRPQQYLEAQADPVAQFTGPVCGHMNADHGDAIVSMVRNVAGIEVAEARMVGLDSLGVVVACTTEEPRDTFRLKLPFSEPALDRKSVKDRIVAMTRAAAKAV